MNDQDIIEKNGLRFRVHIEDDSDHGAPWTENDGHGVVSDWVTRDKKPGERVLNTDGRSKRFYDVQASMVIAKRDGWGAPRDMVAWLQRNKAHTVSAIVRTTAGQRAAAAVDADFEYLRRWCADQWRYVGVCVEQIDEDDQPLTDKYLHACWGMESDDDEGLKQAANDYIDEIIGEHVRAEAAAIAEEIEVAYWNSRDVVTA